MLVEFKVKNFRSIRSEQSLSMVASNYSEELPQNLVSCDDIPSLKGTRLVKAVAVYGANASGKSNVVGALRFLAEFVRDSATKLQSGAPTGTQPFKLDPACLIQSSKFEVVAVINEVLTRYGIEMTRERVISEYLVAYPHGKPQKWFERDWDLEKQRYTWSKPTKNFKHDAALQEKTRENASFLSVCAQFNSEQANRVSQWFIKQLYFIGLNPSFTAVSAARMLLTQSESLDVFSRLLRQADFGIGAVKCKALESNEKAAELLRAAAAWGTPREAIDAASVIFQNKEIPPEVKPILEQAMENVPPIPELYHRGANGVLTALDFLSEESAGTQRFFELFTELAFGVAASRVLVADEIENSLHPLLLQKIVKFCLTPKKSIRDTSQFVFTTHNPLLLDQTLLRRDQIWFTEKDSEGATRLYPLTDFNPRKDESLVKGYLAGRYGGVSFIPEGLKLQKECE